jgi:dienelactone hydrolase
MRNVLPLASMGCIAIIILGILVGGVIMIGYGVNQFLEKEKHQDKDKQKSEQPAPGGPGDRPKAAQTLLEARSNFKTNLRPSDLPSSNLVPAAVDGAQLVFYESGSRRLAAYLSNPIAGKQPAVVWVHSEFGDIGPDDWKRAKRFQDADIVLMVPSFRGENADSSKFEMLYGEVEDLLAAVKFLAAQPGVDPDRIYVIGHDKGGTLALLAATTGETRVRAFFSIVGLPNLEAFVAAGNQIKDPTPPFDPKRAGELHLRSAQPFAGAIRTPTFYFGVGLDDIASKQARDMLVQAASTSPRVPFKAFGYGQATRANILGPVIGFIAGKIVADKDRGSAFTIEDSETKGLFPKK